MTLIEKFVKSPKDFPDNELDALASEVRSRIIEVVGKNGGHLASSLGAVETVIALLRIFDPIRDKVVWDVGHQTYAWKILTGRNDNFDTLRKHRGISGFPKMSESKADAYGAGHAGTAVSAALGMAAARDIRGGTETVVAVVGDAAITNGISLEGLNNAVSATKRFILVLNDNEMSIGENVGAISRHFARILLSRRYNRAKNAVERFAYSLRLHWLSGVYHRIESAIKSLFVKNIIFENLGLRYIGPLDGHNIVRLSRAFAIARDYNRPIILHIATKKGRGYPPAEDNPSKWHGVSPFDVESGEPKFPSARDYSKVFGEILTKKAEDDGRIVAITAAMRSGTGLDVFAKTYPERFYDVGICEEHAAVFAAGLAANGMRPFLALYSTFAQRAVDNIFHDISIQNLPVTIALDRAGVVGADGVTHNGIYDIAMTRCLPNLIIAQPRDELRMRSLIGLSLEMASPFIIRYPRGKIAKIISDGGDVKFCKAEILSRIDESRHGRKIWIWALGDMIPTAFEVKKILEQSGDVTVGIVDPVFIKPLDRDLLTTQNVSGAEIVTIENGTLYGGFGSAVLEASEGKKVRCFGFGDRPVEHGSQAELLAAHGLDAKSIARKLVIDR